MNRIEKGSKTLAISNTVKGAREIYAKRFERVAPSSTVPVIGRASFRGLHSKASCTSEVARSSSGGAV